MHIDSGMDVDERAIVQPEVRIYDTESSEGAFSRAENVHYRWYYDENTVEILDADGNKVGNNDDNGDYNAYDNGDYNVYDNGIDNNVYDDGGAVFDGGGGYDENAYSPYAE